MTANDIWTANKYLKEPTGDGGRPRIPTLRTKGENGADVKVTDNEQKANLFAKTFFPPPPIVSSVPKLYNYPSPLPEPPQISEEQILRQIARLSPYKAPGPDEIPNVVLQKCADLIVPHRKGGLLIIRASAEVNN